jgi:hypothetical protein
MRRKEPSLTVGLMPRTLVNPHLYHYPSGTMIVRFSMLGTFLSGVDCILHILLL